MKRLTNFWKRKDAKLSVPVKEDLFEGDRNKVLARHIILNDLEHPLEGEGLATTSEKNVHIVIVGNGALCLAILRQVALTAHYPNFDDATGANRTKLTWLDTNAHSMVELENTKSAIERVTGNLLKESYCSCLLFSNNEVNEEWNNGRCNSFIDVELEIVGLNDATVEDYLKREKASDSRSIVTVIAPKGTIEKEVADYIQTHFLQLYEIDEKWLNEVVPDNLIDVRRARLVNMIYQVGTYLKDIYSSNIYNAKAYELALGTFLGHTPESKINSHWEAISKRNSSQYANELKLSNVFCGDCFDTKIRSARLGAKGKEGIKELIEKNLEGLAKAEHARWNVEKLILGFRPYTEKEHYADEFLFGEECAQMRKQMKTEYKAHIDICSCNELIRINPENFKYDCFLTLAIDDIMSREG